MSERHKVAIDTDLFGEDARRVSQIITFTDEIKADDLSPWAYLTMLSIPAARAREAHGRLIEDRAVLDYDGELKWRKLRRTNERQQPTAPESLAKSWLQRVVHESDLWSFTVLGIDTGTLCVSAFGDRPGQQRTNYYRRFYKSALAYHTSCLSRSYDTLEVLRCYHDTERNLEQDEWFEWHPLARIEAVNPQVAFKSDRVTFVNSDHSKEPTHKEASQFVQLCDVLGGSIRYLLEAHGRNFSRDNACGPMVERVKRINCPKRSGNVNSPYKHYGRASLSYFPNRALTKDELDDIFMRAKSTFYKGRPLVLLDLQSGQQGLDLG